MVKLTLFLNGSFGSAGLTRKNKRKKNDVGILAGACQPPLILFGDSYLHRML